MGEEMENMEESVDSTKKTVEEEQREKKGKMPRIKDREQKLFQVTEWLRGGMSEEDVRDTLGVWEKETVINALLEEARMELNKPKTLEDRVSDLESANQMLEARLADTEETLATMGEILIEIKEKLTARKG